MRLVVPLSFVLSIISSFTIVQDHSEKCKIQLAPEFADVQQVEVNYLFR